MRDPQSIDVNEDDAPDSGLVDRCCRRGVRAGRVLFLAGFPNTAAPCAPARPAHLLQSLLGSAGGALFPDDRLRQQGRAAPRHEHALLDADLLRHAGGHRRGALLPAAPRRWSRAARPAARTCRATSTSVRSATISSPPVAATASAPCAPRTSSAPAAAMSWRTTTCRRACACWRIAIRPRIAGMHSAIGKCSEPFSVLRVIHRRPDALTRLRAAFLQSSFRSA